MTGDKFTCDATLIIKNIGQLLTMQIPADYDEGQDLPIMKGAALAADAGKIVWTGKESEIAAHVRGKSESQVIDAGGRVVTPGLIESHTHLVFAGSREKEFQMRMEGKTYLEILRAGGGILSTVNATRKASEEELISSTLTRLDTLVKFGITTCEIKSGYGLSTESELKMLRVINKLRDLQPVRIVPTFLGAHAMPPEYKEKRESYIDSIIHEMIPSVVENSLAEFCDTYIEKSAFSYKEAEKILVAAKEKGMKLKLHAGQFNDLGGAELGARLGAVSIDHLEKVSDEDLNMMAEKNIVAVALPGAAFFVREKMAGLGRMRRAGVKVAVSTDLNPGSCMTENLPLMMTMAVVNGGLSIKDAMCAVTTSAAASLDLPHPYGTLAPGAPADVVIYNAVDWRKIIYHYAVSHVSTVLIDGKVVFDEKD